MTKAAVSKPVERINRERILVIDDDQGWLQILKMRLVAMGFEVVLCNTSAEALEEARKGMFELCLTDLRIGEEDGVALMEELLLILPHLHVIIMTGHGSIPSAVEAMKKGAYGYLTKPFEDDEFKVHVEKALAQQRMSREIQRLKLLVKEQYGLENVIARSSKMQALLQDVAMIAPTKSTVCLFGETGTGKEVIARVIHANGRRANGPFVPVNCAAIPESLFESELFGHVKGAFTGALMHKPGLFQAANGGTLFLDEIGEMSMMMQAKLLRAIQDREIWAVGSEHATKVDVRIVVATNKDLQEAVQEGRFREDLFFRIHVVPITIPPLRERRDDIPVLAAHFLQQCAARLNRNLEGFMPETLQRLMLYSWPGNVRELENVVESAAVMSRDSMIVPELLPVWKLDKRDLKPLKEARSAFERSYLKELLETTENSFTRAAELAGIEEVELMTLLKRMGLHPTEKAPPTKPQRKNPGPALRA